MTKRNLIATAAAIFAAGTLATAAHAQTGVKCGASNACKGQGWTQAGTSLECTAKGGKVQ